MHYFSKLSRERPSIQQVWDAIKKYNPESIGYAWDDSNPRIQLEPIGTRGYIELHPVKGI